MRRLRLLAAVLCLAITSTAFARSAAPPTGVTMAPPSEGSCANNLCHTGGPAGTGLQLTLLEGATPFTSYTPGTSYTLTFGMAPGTVTGRARWGFEMTCLNSGGTMAGSWTAGTDQLTGVLTTASRAYIAHKSGAFGPDGTFRGNAGPVSWTFTWTAPVAGPLATDVTFYVCGNAANNNNSSSGDAIKCTTFAVTVATAPVDTDGDTLLDSAETGTCTSANDADTDDDGLSDGEERALAQPTNPCDCDTDGDTLPDGLELGVTAPLRDTNTGINCFVADLDNSTTTNPLEADTDGDSPDGIQCLDGVEDANGDGFVDGGETDPNDTTDCPVPTGLELRIDARITSLMNGPTAPCGLRTTPAIGNWMLTPCDAPLTTGCSLADSVPPTRAMTVDPGIPGPDLTLTGEADADAEAGVLTYYELEGCDWTLVLSKSGADLILDAQ